MAMLWVLLYAHLLFYSFYSCAFAARPDLLELIDKIGVGGFEVADLFFALIQQLVFEDDVPFEFAYLDLIVSPLCFELLPEGFVLCLQIVPNQVGISLKVHVLLGPCQVLLAVWCLAAVLVLLLIFHAIKIRL